MLDVEEGVLDVDKDEERDRQTTQNSLCLHCLVSNPLLVGCKNSSERSCETYFKIQENRSHPTLSSIIILIASYDPNIVGSARF